jgi:hypothetical protein
MKETFFSESTEKDVSTSASVLLLGTVGPLVAATVAFDVAAGCAGAGAFFALRSSAHDFGASGLGGDAFGVSSAPTAASDADTAASLFCVDSC